jgi:hypothetical protein
MKKVCFDNANNNHSNADLVKKVCECSGCIGCSVYKKSCNIFTPYGCNNCKIYVCPNCLLIGKCNDCYEDYIGINGYTELINNYNKMSINKLKY